MRQVLQPHTTVCEKVHDRADLYVKFGSAPAAPKPMQTVNNDMLDPLDRCRACKLFGCNKKYTERANTDDACRHHTKPQNTGADSVSVFTRPRRRDAVDVAA